MEDTIYLVFLSIQYTRSLAKIDFLKKIELKTKSGLWS